ncbi:uncharacterized protein LOC111054590 [Nilaparvata lugens]|uniref:uncharacterized protein LOC111054590 n=1 Tax=Nilaparvata lugens TaxID=108931 RepID=UPI000B980EFD|nr:uncharacterized protein LOC111054590 [Nilaparvata lugens]XP_039286237.1 uncharacterized protein LOC111054590 [Nilaparvata lugens]
MAIIKSCCCWRSLRKGCYASAVYTGLYFLLTFSIMLGFIYDERHYYSGTVEIPMSPSVLEPEALSPTTMTFQLVILVWSSLGIVTSILLVYGIFRDKRELLVPWIITVICTVMVDLVHTTYMFSAGTISFNPITAFLYTSDFFLHSLNAYCVLCVVSQYQEYKAGRGTADCYRNTMAVRFVARPGATATTCESSRRQATTTCLDLQSPSCATSTLDSDKLSRKHVQFGGGGGGEDISPDHLHVNWRETTSSPRSETGSTPPWILTGTKSARKPTNLDTVPLISTPSPSPTSEKK